MQMRTAIVFKANCLEIHTVVEEKGREGNLKEPRKP